MARYCRENGVCLIINDDVELALQCGADGVHLGGDDGDPAVARKLLGNGRILGVSCYNDPSRVRAAVSHGADYVALGAMFASTTKPDAVRASLALLSDISADCSVPVATIGGITLENAPALISSGADMVAVVSDLFEAPDIQGRARAFQNLFNTSIHSMRTA